MYKKQIWHNTYGNCPVDHSGGSYLERKETKSMNMVYYYNTGDNYDYK